MRPTQLCKFFVAALGLSALGACDGRSPVSASAGHEVARGPVAPERYVTSPLTSVMGDDPGATTTAMAGVEVDARVLLITANGSDTGYAAVVQALRHLGTPYDVFNATTEAELTAGRLANGTHGRYQGIILDVGNLSTGNASAFSANEWTVLADYEAQFQVRRVALYSYPEAAYGLVASGGGFDTGATPLSLNCTALAAEVFGDLNCASSLKVRHAWAYPSDAQDANTAPLFVDGGGKVFGAIRQHGQGRESLVLTFAHSPTLVHSLALMYGAIRWVTRGVYLGERHVYVGSQIDDLFLSTDLYGTNGSYRITAADLQALFDWQQARRAQTITADLRLDWAANGSGSPANDPLTAKALAIGAGFKWISHTWSHPYLTITVPQGEEDNWAGTFDTSLIEFTRNDAFLRNLGIQPYNTANIVTPHISGLDNPEVMRAAAQAGIRYLVTDTSQPGMDNPSPNAGIYSPFQPSILMIPRRANNLFYHVSTPAEWVEAYNVTYRSFWGRDLTYQEILDLESDVLLQYLLRGENDPWMFHQANARDFGSGHSLLSDLHDKAFDKYAAIAKLPIVSPTMEELGRRVAERMKYDASGASAVIGPGRQITVRATNAATVPVTGLCTPTAETYGGQKIAYLALPAAGEATFSLDGCNPGTGGAGGAGGAAGTGGSAGTGGAAGMAGAPGTGGAGTAGAAGNAGAGTGGATQTGTGGSVTPGAGGGAGAGTGGAGGGPMTPGSGGSAGAAAPAGTGGSTVGGDGNGGMSGVPIGFGGRGGSNAAPAGTGGNAAGGPAGGAGGDATSGTGGAAGGGVPSTDGGTNPPKTSNGGGGCSVATSGGATGSVWFLGVAVWLLGRQRSRSARRARS